MEYHDNKTKEEVVEKFDNIANPAKWDKTGILRSEERAKLELLEYLLNDNLNEVSKYKEWKPLEK